MQTASIRKKLHDYIDNSDEKLLKMMFAIAREYNEEGLNDEFTTEDIKLFDERKQKRLSGESKGYSWQEAKDIVTGKRHI